MGKRPAMAVEANPRGPGRIVMLRLRHTLTLSPRGRHKGAKAGSMHAICSHKTDNTQSKHKFSAKP